jgi:predicted AlkP superfamily phosphohydrolase/phosphomutase
MGTNNPAAFAARAFLLFGVPALLLRGGAGDSSRRSSSSSRSAAPAARSWRRRPGFPQPALGPQQPARARVPGRRRGAAGIGDPDAGDVSPEAFADGTMLSGLGVPDLSGRIGKPRSTSDPFFTLREGNDFSVEVTRLETNVGKQVTRIAGPPGRAFGKENTIDLPLTLTVPESKDRLIVEAGGARAELKPGQWSDWLSLDFRVNPLITIHGYARLRLATIAPEIGLYLSPIQFDPDHLPPGFTISSPPGFAKELVARFGRYKTMGWGIDTWSIQSATLSEEAFLEDVRETCAQERKMLGGLLAGGQKMLFYYFEFPDRVGHVFWRLRDPQHPAYDAALAARYGRAVEDSYQTMDQIVGDTAKALKPEDILIVLSDHGFATWRRSVNYNSWLVENGYLVLKGSAKRQNLGALLARAVLGSRGLVEVKAYAMGLGDITSTCRDAGRRRRRSRRGYEALRTELIAHLTDLTDPKNGEKAVSRVFKREDVYKRYDPRLIPDLIVANRPGYRVSWQSSLGVPTGNVFEDNRDVWSGDHCSLDPDLVRGVFFSTKAFRSDTVPGIADVTASVRALVGGSRSRRGRSLALVRPRASLRRARARLRRCSPGSPSAASTGSRPRQAPGPDRNLKARLAESEKKEATLAEELKRLGSLEIATRGRARRATRRTSRAAFPR